MTAIRSLTFGPALIVLAAAVGFAVCKVSGVEPHIREMLLACGIAFVAVMLAPILAVVRQKKTDTAGLFLSALIGTVIHLALILALGIAVFLVLKPSNAFVFWLLAVYWLSLIGMCVAFSRLLRMSAPAGHAAK